jgi:hypothetical protein
LVCNEKTKKIFSYEGNAGLSLEPELGRVSQSETEEARANIWSILAGGNKGLTASKKRGSAVKVARKRESK